jgi:hypothetical protein
MRAKYVRAFSIIRTRSRLRAAQEYARRKGASIGRSKEGTPDAAAGASSALPAANHVRASPSVGPEVRVPAIGSIDLPVPATVAKESKDEESPRPCAHPASGAALVSEANTNIDRLIPGSHRACVKATVLKPAVAVPTAGSTFVTVVSAEMIAPA